MSIGASIWGPAVASAVAGYFSNRSSSNSSPTLPPELQGLQGQILRMVQQRLMSDADLSGYSASGQADINHVFDTIKQSQSNNLTARGLSTSPVAASVDATRENARAGQIAGFRNSIPLLARQLQDQDFTTAQGLLNSGRGIATVNQSGGGAAGAATNLAAYLGYLRGRGQFGATPSGSSLGYEPNDTNGWG